MPLFVGGARRGLRTPVVRALVLLVLIWACTAIGARAMHAEHQSVEMAPADQNMIGDPIGDVTDGRGDVVEAAFWSDIDALDVTVAEFEALETADWRYGSSRIVLHLDLDGDGAEEYEVMLRWMYGGQVLGSPVTNSSGKYLCDVGQHIREHDVLRQYSFIAEPECLGYPTRIWWRGEMVHCDLTTGIETVDRFPDHGWLGPLTQHPPVGVTAPVPENPQMAPPIQPCGPGVATTTSGPLASTTTVVVDPTPPTPPTQPTTTPPPATPDPTPAPSAVPQISVVDRVATAALGARRGG